MTTSATPILNSLPYDLKIAFQGQKDPEDMLCRILRAFVPGNLALLAGRLEEFETTGLLPGTTVRKQIEQTLRQSEAILSEANDILLANQALNRLIRKKHPQAK